MSDLIKIKPKKGKRKDITEREEAKDESKKKGIQDDKLSADQFTDNSQQ